MALSPIFITTPKMWVVNSVAADGLNNKTIATAPATGSRVEHLWALCSEAKIIDLKITVGAVTSIIWRSTLVGGVAKDVLAEAMPLTEKAFMILGNAAVLSVAVTVTLTSTNVLYLAADGGDY